MNGTYYKNPTFPSAEENDGVLIPTPGIDYLPKEQSYIENILRLNKGKEVKAYVSFSDSTIWRDKIFEGNIEEAGKDHLIISKNVNYYLIPLIYINYVEFNEKIIYRPIELKREKED